MGQFLHEHAFLLIVCLVLGGLPVSLLIALYVYAPFAIRRKQIVATEVVFDPIELPQLPNDISTPFMLACRDLAESGFEAIGTLCRHVETSKQDTFVSIWINRVTSDSAQIVGVRTPSPMGGYSVVALLAFHTEFTDGTSIETHNSPSATVFPRNPKQDPVRCAGVHDGGLIYRFHRARVDRDRNGRSLTLQRVPDAQTRMRTEHREMYERLIKAGYYTLDAQGQSYVPTVKGGFLMTYRLLPPFKQIQRLRRHRKTERTLRSLGFGGIETFRKSQRPRQMTPP